MRGQDDDTLQEFDRLYNMYYARAERYELGTNLHRERTENDITYGEFYLWSERARRERGRYVRGEVSAVEFLATVSM